jgi:hypothetical protein
MGAIPRCRVGRTCHAAVRWACPGPATPGIVAGAEPSPRVCPRGRACSIVPAAALSGSNIRRSMFSSRERLYDSWVRDHYRCPGSERMDPHGPPRVVPKEVVQHCYDLARRKRTSAVRPRARPAPAVSGPAPRGAARHRTPSAGTRFEPCDAATDGLAWPDATASVEPSQDILRAMRSALPTHREVLIRLRFEPMPVAEVARALEVARDTGLCRAWAAPAGHCGAASNLLRRHRECRTVFGTGARIPPGGSPPPHA